MKTESGRKHLVSSGPHGPWTRIDDVVSAVGDEPCLCHDFSGDGIDDLLLKFSASELTVAFDLDELPQGQSIELLLEGTLNDGTVFEGVDCIEVLEARRETRAKRHKKRAK